MALKRRAARAEAGRTAEERLQIVAFEVHGERYGLEISRVAEIDRMQPITKVPRPLPFVEGVIRLREMIIPVVDLARRFGLEPVAPDRQTRILIARLHGQQIGLIVHRVSEVLEIPRASLGPAPSLAFERGTGFVAGMVRLADGLISVLDLERLFSSEEFEQLQAQQSLF